MPYFSCTSPRQVRVAQSMYYPTPVLHPDRVMADHDLIYMEEGRWEVWEEDRAFSISPGDVLVLFAGRHHFGKLPCSAGTRTLFVHAARCPDDSFARDCAALHGVQLPSLIHCQNAPGVAECFRQLADVCWSEDPLRALRLPALFQLTLCALSSASSHSQQPRRRLALAVQSALRTDPQGRLTAADLAERFGVSPRALRYAFERECGVSLHRYHLNLRLDMAMNVLRTDPLRTLRDLADAFGFYDEFHFSRAFKQRFGVSPRHAAAPDDGVSAE